MQVFRRRARADYFKTAALISNDPEKKQEYFNEYVDAAFPYVAEQEKRSPMSNAKSILDKFFAAGPLRIDRSNEDD